MSESIDWPRLPGGRRRRRLLVLLAAVVSFIFGVSVALSYYVDALWFGSLGYGDVFWKRQGVQWVVFAAFAVTTFLFLYGSFLALKRVHRTDLWNSQTVLIGGQIVTLPVEMGIRLIALGVSLVIGIGTGFSMMAEWPSLALYWHAPPAAGAADPIFGKPVDFYLFTLPVWQLLAGWLMTLAVVTCVAAVVFIFISASTRALAERRDSYSLLPWRGFSITFAFLLLAMALRVYIGRFERLFDGHTIFSGVTYTDAHVWIPGMLVICVALVLGALAAIVNGLSVGRLRWLVTAVLPSAACYLVLQLCGWYVDSFIVKPNELARERPYIAHNIEWTRQAYGLDQFVQREFQAEGTVEAADRANNQATFQNIRLWDWRALQDTLRQIQEIRTYYDFPDIDIDRYEINGSIRQVMLATRELNVNKLPESSRNWINEKLIYTHGYGITMNPVNGFTPEGLPDLILSNMPVHATPGGPTVNRPEIYFGELTNTDVYVNTRQKEFNYPEGQANSVTSYQGKGGIILGGFLRRLVLAFDRGDITKLPFSDDVNSESRLLMRRNLRERISTLAPFLSYESDPYIVIGNDGRLSWIMDAFTVSDNYPYSSHYRPDRDRERDRDPVNYVRNSVKVVVDAYDGSTTFYVLDAHDPIIAAWRRVFPGLFKDASEMPPDLRKHLRYPELLLKLQASVYGLYHMTDPDALYNRQDLWTVASKTAADPSGAQTAQPMDPNFVLMKLPGESGMEFVEILPFTPANRNNLIGWMAGRSDGPHYGTSVIYNFPKTKLIDGPQQIEARIDQNAQLSGQLTLWNQQGSHVRRGTLLVIPSGRALLYAEPIYLQAERSPMPELRLVVLALQDRLAYGPTFESAMAALFGAGESSISPTAAAAPAPTEPARSSPTAAAGQPAADLNPLIKEAAKALADYQRLTAEGKLGEAGQKLEQLKRALDKLNARQK
ncbi:MAG TPA: UPF0182 family protein [Candidatus Saccharimonadales bacterium]|jgi:uncharacterized membrane protein (UPF0182 family)|nr:UPF0182 family protein [Candidatus Saccharimonadales bacterium]